VTKRTTRGGSCVIAVLALACSRGQPRVDHTYDPYLGSAPYPNTRPQITLPSGDFAIVPSSGDDRLIVVDLGAGTAIANVPVARSAFVLNGPHQVVADPAKRTAYVIDAFPAALETAGAHSHGNSTRPGYIQALAFGDLRAVAEQRVNPNPAEIAVSDDGKRVVVTHYDLTAAAALDVPIEQRRSTLALVDPTTMLPFGTPEPDELLVCVAPHGLVVSRPDAATAFVACYGEDAVAVVDLADPTQPVVRVPLGPSAQTSGAPVYGPYGVALSPDGSRVAVAEKDGKEVRFFDVATQTMEPLVVPMLGQTYVPAWSQDGSKLYVPTDSLDAVEVVDTKTGTVVGRRVFDPATCVAPIEVAFGSDPSVFHVVCEGTATTNGALVTLDAATLDVRLRVDVGAFPGRPYIGKGP
jgi:DNA-binding beta-propeller fold protein YncE